MLISLIVRRREPVRRLSGQAVAGLSERGRGRRGHLARVALQDVGELLDEGLQLDRDAVDVARETVVGDHRRDRSEQADRGGDQRFGDAGRHCGQRHLCRFDSPMNACMMPHTVPNRPTYGDTEPTEARNDRFDSITSSSRGSSRASRAGRRRAGRCGRRRGVVQLHEFAHAGGKDALHRRHEYLLRRIGEEVVQVLAGPELALELVVAGTHAAQAQTACRR